MKNKLFLILTFLFLGSCTLPNINRDNLVRTSSSAAGGYLGYHLSDGDFFSTSVGSTVGLILGETLAEFIGQILAPVFGPVAADFTTMALNPSFLSQAPRIIGFTVVPAVLVTVSALLSLFVGVRFGLIFILGLALGMTFEAFRFGFAGPWRATIMRREPAGFVAQLISIGCVSIIAFPLITINSSELVGAHAPIGIAMVGGAFFFGLSMQLVLGCGSGTLINAGSGNTVALIVLPFFAIGSFAGAYHLDWWINFGTQHAWGARLKLSASLKC